MFSLGGDVRPLALSPSSIHFSWKGRWNNPLKLFKKSRWRRLRCLGLSDMCFHWSGWARWDQHGLKHWSGCIVQFAFTCWRPISPLLFLSNSAIDCKWGKLAPAVITGILRIWMRDTVDDGLWLNSKDESKKKNYRWTSPQRPRWRQMRQYMDCPPKNVTIVERWPLVEVRLYFISSY